MKISLKITLLSLLLSFFIVSCKIEPQPIEYGKDQCNFCVMNIVDQNHSAQYVTKKGKQFKFDAIECMVNEVNEKGEENIAVLVVANYGSNGEMIPTSEATFIITPKIKSPMGANLLAVNSREKAMELLKPDQTEEYTWDELKIRLSDK